MMMNLRWRGGNVAGSEWRQCRHSSDGQKLTKKLITNSLIKFI